MVLAASYIIVAQRVLLPQSTVGGKKPDNIPAQSAKVYAGEGWVGLSDWLGTGSGAR